MRTISYQFGSCIDKDICVGIRMHNKIGQRSDLALREMRSARHRMLRPPSREPNTAFAFGASVLVTGNFAAILYRRNHRQACVEPVEAHGQVRGPRRVQ